MSILEALRSFAARPHSAGPRRRFSVEPLEDRRLLTTVIDFESLETAGTDVTDVGRFYVEDGFRLTTSGNAGFQSPQTENTNWFAGSTGLYDNTIGARTFLAAIDGSAFDLTSIDLSRVSLTISGGATVNFIGDKADGTQVFQSFTVGFELAFDTFTFEGFDDLLFVSWAQERPFHQFDNIVINGDGGGSPPVAVDDTAVLDEDTSLLITWPRTTWIPTVIWIPSTTEVVSGPSNGSLMNHADGTFTYTPAPNFHGSDSFVYQICDASGECSTATVEITVNPVIDADIDFRPGDEGNNLNLKSKGKTKFAILSTEGEEGFDASSLDLADISFKVNGESIEADKLTLEDVDGDGDLDLVVRFETQDLAKILTNQSTELVLSAD